MQQPICKRHIIWSMWSSFGCFEVGREHNLSTAGISYLSYHIRSGFVLLRWSVITRLKGEILSPLICWEESISPVKLFCLRMGMWWRDIWRNNVTSYSFYPIPIVYNVHNHSCPTFVENWVQLSKQNQNQKPAILTTKLSF